MILQRCCGKEQQRWELVLRLEFRILELKELDFMQLPNFLQGQTWKDNMLQMSRRQNSLRVNKLELMKLPLSESDCQCYELCYIYRI